MPDASTIQLGDYLTILHETEAYPLLFLLYAKNFC